MAIFTEEDKRLIKKINDTVVRLQTLMENGLIKRVNQVEKSHYKLRRNFLFLLGIFIGVGLLNIDNLFLAIRRIAQFFT